jgi:hypothetical protein
MTHAATAAAQLRQIADEVQAGDAPGSIDWKKILDLFMQVLPLILALFQKPAQPAP